MIGNEVIFAVYVNEEWGESWEMVISEQMEVYFKRGRFGGYEHLRFQGWEVDDFMHEMDDVTSEWGDSYGQDFSSKEGGWLVILEQGRVLRRWGGRDEYPVNWDEFLGVVGQFIENKSNQ